jgi:hypothetical protein
VERSIEPGIARRDCCIVLSVLGGLLRRRLLAMNPQTGYFQSPSSFKTEEFCARLLRVLMLWNRIKGSYSTVIWGPQLVVTQIPSTV